MVTGGFGLVTRNERGDTMVDLCSRNSLVVMNTMFKQHARRLYNWKSPDKITRHQIDYILCTGRWKSSIKRVTTIPGADCSTDHSLLIAIVKIKLKKTKRNKTTPKYDLENISTKYTVEVKNRYSILQVDGKNPEDLWIDIRDAVIETAEKLIPKVKKRKVTKWLTEETIKIAEERREGKRKGEIEKYKKLNAEFQKKARYDKEINLREKCRKIEENNKKGRTRDLYKEIKDITGLYTARCGVMNRSSGKTATEKREVQIRWKQYTEELYRRDPKFTDTFPETRYEDEPHILEIEVKDAIKHISNRKSSGCDGIPIELLKAGVCRDASIKYC